MPKGGKGMERIVCAMMDLIASEVCGKTIDKTQYALTDEMRCSKCISSQNPMTLPAWWGMR